MRTSTYIHHKFVYYDERFCKHYCLWCTGGQPAPWWWGSCRPRWTRARTSSSSSRSATTHALSFNLILFNYLSLSLLLLPILYSGLCIRNCLSRIQLFRKFLIRMDPTVDKKSAMTEVSVKCMIVLTINVMSLLALMAVIFLVSVMALWQRHPWCPWWSWW